MSEYVFGFMLGFGAAGLILIGVFCFISYCYEGHPQLVKRKESDDTSLEV
jgi:hypothetical protein